MKWFVVVAFCWYTTRSVANGRDPSCDSLCECQEISPKDITVHCARKGLPWIPTDIPTNVTYLDVSFNNITALDGASIKTLPHLRKLDLRNNLISRIDSWAFQNMIALEELDLDNNLLQTISSYMFTTASHLRMLTLGNNYINKIEHSAFIHLSLDSLNLRDNVKLTDLDPDMFKDSSIHTLILDGCEISSIDTDTFVPLNQSLKILSMSNMRKGLTIGPTALSSLNLDRLTLVRNKMSRNHTGFLSRQLRVKSLDLSLNSFDVLDLSMLRGLHNTETLYFKKSSIVSVIMTDESLDNLKGVIEFDLAGNALTSFPVELFHWLPNLSSLIVADNPIRNLSQNSSSSLSRLESLDISNISLECRCDLAWFSNWRNTTKTVVIGELCSVGRRPNQAISNCSAPHALTAWVESGDGVKSTVLDIFCRASGDPSPMISLRQIHKSSAKHLLAMSSDGEVHFRRNSTECYLYSCTAVNHLGNSTLSFHVCPSGEWPKTPSPSTSSENPSNHIKYWILTIIVSLLLLGVLLTMGIVYIMKKHKRSQHRIRLRSDSPDHGEGEISSGSHMTLTRRDREDDDTWNS